MSCWRRLFTIFPRFQANYDGPIFDQPLSYDSVLTAFTSDFALEFPNSSDDQLRDFAALLNAAVADGGELEHAFSQCFSITPCRYISTNYFGLICQAQRVNASSPNQTMKPTAPLRNAFSMFATTSWISSRCPASLVRFALSRSRTPAVLLLNASRGLSPSR